MKSPKTPLEPRHVDAASRMQVCAGPGGAGHGTVELLLSARRGRGEGGVGTSHDGPLRSVWVGSSERRSRCRNSADGQAGSGAAIGEAVRLLLSLESELLRSPRPAIAMRPRDPRDGDRRVGCVVTLRAATAEAGLHAGGRIRTAPRRGRPDRTDRSGPAFLPKAEHVEGSRRTWAP
jgi:hypothetical protein